MKQTNKIMKKKEEYTISQYNVTKDFTEFVTQFLWNVQEHGRMEQKSKNLQEQIVNQKNLINEWTFTLKKSTPEELEELKKAQEGKIYDMLVSVITELRQDES